MYPHLRGFYSELVWLGFLVSLATLVSLISGYWFIVFTFVALFYFFRHYYYFKLFISWLESQTKYSHRSQPQKTIPRLPAPIGVWGGIFQAAYRYAVEQLEKSQQANVELKKVRLATTLLPEALIALSPDNRIEWLNLAAERLLGFQQDDRGKRVESFLRDPAFVQYLQAGEFSGSVEFYSSIDSYQLLSAQLFPYHQNHYLLIVRDITEVNKMAQMRRDFVANASHELRTPLTVLNGYLEVMVDAEDEALSMWQKPLEHMNAQSKRMMRIIEDLLTLSSIENKTSDTNKVSVDVIEMIEGIKSAAEEISNGKHLIEVDLEEGLVLHGYKQPLESVFTNLVTNAVRYTPDGGKIVIRWYRRNESVCFSVTDTGIGIAREDIPRLTERFFRVDTARSRETGGTGLGLAIVKHVLDLHQAELEIESKLYVGSTFIAVFKSSNDSLG